MRVYLYIWVVARQELCTRSTREHNSLTGHDNLWALKFDLFFFLNFKRSLVINPLFPLALNVIMTYYVRKSLCDSPLSQRENIFSKYFGYCLLLLILFYNNPLIYKFLQYIIFVKLNNTRGNTYNKNNYS